MSKDPLQWCGEIAWYLTERDAACGYRSSFGSQIAAIEGSTGSGASGAERWLHLTSRYGSASPIAKDRVMRRRWAALSAYHRDLLAVHYTGRAVVETALGYRRFPRGLEAGLGIFSAVALHLAKLAGTERQLVIAGETGRPSAMAQFRDSAKDAVAEAHRAYYDLVKAEIPGDDPDDGDESFADLQEELAEVTGVYSVGSTVQREGRWVQR